MQNLEGNAHFRVRGLEEWPGDGRFGRASFASDQPSAAAAQARQACAVVEGPATTIVAAAGRASQGRYDAGAAAHEAAKRSKATSAFAKGTVNVRPRHQV